MSSNILNKESGFTLLESMIAMVILVIGVLGMFQMQMSAIGGNATATQVTYGTSWVTDQIEFLINQPYDDPKKKGSLDPLEDTTATGAHGPVTSPDGNYSITWTVNEDQLMDDLKTISITIQYTDRGTAKSIVMDYVKAST